MNVPQLVQMNQYQKPYYCRIGSITTHRLQQPRTVDLEIFTLKIIHMKNFRVVKFSRSHSIREIFLTVDDCNMDECLESSWRLVYYQVSGEPGIARRSRQSDI